MSSAEDRLRLLISKCRLNSDVDSKVDAVTKLQAEFEAGVELGDVDGLIAGLKTCLRTPNQHLNTATLSALVPLFPLLVAHQPPSPHSASSSSNGSSSATDAAILHHALNAFLPSGGIIDRLGDNRERAREKAREALLAIGAVVVKSTPPAGSRVKEGKGAETPLHVYERYLRDQGLSSKSWRVREQSILTLVRLRRAHPLFPLRPFLTPLVDALEDGDGSVRDCARQSVVEIFTGPGVTDAARTDLKKEMSKKGVRKAIVESVVTGLLSGGGRNTPSVDSVEGKEEAAHSSAMIPRIHSAPTVPTMGRSASQGIIADTDRPASRSGETGAVDTEVAPVYISSARDLENEFSKMLPAFEGKETEHNWLARERAVTCIRGMLKGEAHSRYSEAFIAGLKNGVLEGTYKALASLRTTLATGTCALYKDLAVSLGPGLDPFAETLLIHLLKMAGFTKKIVATQSQAVVDLILIHTSCHPRQTLQQLWASVQEKTVQARTFAMEHVKVFLDAHGLRSKHLIESSGGADVLEKCVRKGLADPNPGVREKARVSFWSFETIWKERGLNIMEKLDGTARKQLQNACPTSLEHSDLPKPSTPANKKSSVAAAIAASRAKAKQIATAPPTLRHQATSTSHAQASRAMSPPAAVKRSTSPAAPSPRALSPSSPPRSSLLRTGTAGNTAGRRHERTRSSLSSSPSPPSSPTTGNHRRRVSSPLIEQSPTPLSVQQDPHISHRPSSPGLGSPSNLRTSSKLRTSLQTVPNAHQRKPSLPTSAADQNESLLMATTIPLPSESDLADDDSINLISFSAPWELSNPPSDSGTSLNITPSTSRIATVPHSVVEDALRARAAQAESAADQLLELVEPDDGNHVSPIPPSLLPNNGTTPKPPTRTLAVPPVTPINQTSAIMRQAALFQDSPAYNGASPSIFGPIQERKHQTGWWLKRMQIIDRESPMAVDFAQRVQDLEEYITALQKGIADLRTLRNLIVLCHRNPALDIASPPVSPAPLNAKISNGIAMSPSSPSPGANLFANGGQVPMLGDIWDGGNRLEKLFPALRDFLQPNKERELLEHGLFVLWELLPQLDGRDTDILALLLRLRYSQDFNVDEGTVTIRDAQVELMNERNFTLYGLSTMDLCLKSFLAQPIPPFASQDARLRAHAFGLITIAKFIIGLPADILEEELPKIRSTLIDAYLNSEAMVRQAATTAITAAQVILRDEAHLFALLEPLPDDKKNLLTYFFEKNNARGSIDRVDQPPNASGMDRLAKEMDRLDQRISTPPKHRSP